MLKHIRTKVLPRSPLNGACKRLSRASIVLAGCIGVSSIAADIDVNRLMQTGKHVDALKILDGRLKVDPLDPQSRFKKGVVLMEQKRTQEAIDVFLKLSEDFPELPEPHNNLAVLYSQDSQFEKARAALNMAMKTHSSYATAYENLGDIHARMAAQSYGKAMNASSQHVAIQSKLKALTALTIPPRQPAADVAAVKPSATVTAATPVGAVQQTAPSPVPLTTAQKEVAAPVVATALPGSNTAQPHAGVRADEAEVNNAVSAWVNAWATKDMNTYLAAYEDGFVGNGTKSHASWVKLRMARILGKDRIELRIGQPKIELDGDTAVVTFRQQYSGGNVTSDGLKTLTFKKKSGKWKITKEVAAT